MQSSHDWFGESRASFANKSKSIVNKSISANEKNYTSYIKANENYSKLSDIRVFYTVEWFGNTNQSSRHHNQEIVHVL